MYNLVSIDGRIQLEQAHELVDLFKKLDSYTRRGKAVAITNEQGEVVAGNNLAIEYAGKKLV